jgi:hypothetical protein
MIRLGGLSLAWLAAVSGAATVLIISGGSGRSAAQLAALAALRQRPVVIASHGSSAAPAAPSRSSSGPAPAAASSTGTGSGAPAASQTPTATSSNPGASTHDASTQNASTTSAPATRATAASSVPKVGHVFEIALSTHSYSDAFGGRSAAPYLRSLESKGTLLTGFQSLGASELADYLAMVSGQGPDADTSGDCATYAEFPQSAAAQPDGVVRGNGCVYPETALTIGDQVTASGHFWRAYVADMGTQTCAHPNSNASDGDALPGTQPGYDTAHNPFIYFHSLLDLGDCATDDQDLSRLGPALARQARTATFSFIAPGACEDPASNGAASPAATTPTSTTSSSTTTAPIPTAPTTTTPTTTAPTTTAPTTTAPTTTAPTTSTSSAAPAGCPAGQPAGIAAENAFLRLWVPRILASPAYRHNGVVIIAFAAAGQPGSGRPVRTGALLLSRYARRGKRIRRAFGPYSLLRSIEAMLGYKPLAHARTAPSFAAAALTQTK